MSKKYREYLDEYEYMEDCDIISEIEPVFYTYLHGYKFKYKCNHCGNRVGDEVYKCSNCGSYDIVKIDKNEIVKK